MRFLLEYLYGYESGSRLLAQVLTLQTFLSLNRVLKLNPSDFKPL